MSFRSLHIFLIAGIFILTSCGRWRGPKEYIERDGLHSDKKPKEIAAEFKPKIKTEKRAYRKQLRKQWKKKNPGKKRRENPYRGRAKAATG